MYPPKVTDQVVHGVIRDLTVAGKAPSGAAVRAALFQLYGSRGGVTRIYRLLATGRTDVAPPQSEWTGVTVELLRQENQNLRASLQEARQREDRHQTYWGREINKFREQVDGLLRRIDAATSAGADTQALRAEAEAAEVRGGRLDVLLRAFGPAVGRD